MRDLAHAQIAMNPTEGVKRFHEFRKQMFPWSELAKEREHDQFKELLKKEVSKGPIQVLPMQKAARGKLISRRPKQIEEAPQMSAEEIRQHRKFYQQLGKDHRL